MARLESLRGDNTPQGRLYLERLKPLYEATCRTHNEMRKRGIRIVIGGDYGFAANPQGTNARDLEHFVTHFGFSPSEALQAATRTGGEIMQRGHELGLVKEGYLADLLLVDGDPLKDVARSAGQEALCLHHEGRRALPALRGSAACKARALKPAIALSCLRSRSFDDRRNLRSTTAAGVTAHAEPICSPARRRRRGTGWPRHSLLWSGHGHNRIDKAAYPSLWIT